MLGVSGADSYGVRVDTDSSSNIYVIGDTNGSLDGVTLTNSNAAFLTKYNSSGIKQWTKLFQVAFSSTPAGSIFIDDSDNIYLVGVTTGDFNGEISNNGNSLNAYLMKLNTSGTASWTRLLGDGTTYGNDVVVDKDGEVFVTGWTEGNLDGETSNGLRDSFITKYDASGNKQWTTLYGVNQAITYSNAIETDALGNLYIAGETTEGLNGQIQIGAKDYFVMKVSDTGAHTWTVQSGAVNSSTGARGIAMTSSKVYITGYTKGNLDGETLHGQENGFVSQFDHFGVREWTKLIGMDDGESSVSSVSVESIDSDGTNIFLSGWAAGRFGDTLFSAPHSEESSQSSIDGFSIKLVPQAIP
jgi:hypothetical protein